MLSGCSTLVQFQAVHEIRALHYNQLKAALPSLNSTSEVFSLQSADGIWQLFVELMISSDLYHMTPLLHKCSVRFVLNHEAPVVEWFKTLVAKSRGRGFEFHREPKVNFSNFNLNSKF